jgi:hypothetical protein
MEIIKDENYYETLDKRTKEYKEWKANHETASEGLGDSLKKVFDATGVSDLVEWMAGEDCGCDDRRKKLNEVFRYDKPECLREDEYMFLADFYERNPNTVTGDEKMELIKIYNRVFRQNKKPTSCGPCLKSTIEKLKQFFELY